MNVTVPTGSVWEVNMHKGYQGCPTVVLSHQRATGASKRATNQTRFNEGLFAIRANEVVPLGYNINSFYRNIAVLQGFILTGVRT